VWWVHRQKVEVTTVKNVEGQNVERQNAKCDKMSNGTKHRMGQNVEWDKTLNGKNVDWDKRLNIMEKTLNGKNAKWDKMLNK
jgi:hypothetical protein